MRIKMQPNKWTEKKYRLRDDSESIDWEEAHPFVVNPRGTLAHRAKSITTHGRAGEATHCSVSYWCGNQCCFEVDFSDDVIVADPGDRLLCQYCEAKAIAAGEKPADKLAKRHIHLGVLRPHRICCRDENN